MCRLLGVVARRPASLTTLLPEALPRFEGLASEHPDGWGIGWFDQAGDLGVRKEPVRATRSAQFADCVSTIETNAALLHLRQASSGMPLVMANTHPFMADDLCLAHNGYAWPNRTMDSLVSEVSAPAPGGDTDSERYFSLVRAGLRGASNVPEVLQDVARRITDRASITSLNCLLLSPDALYAMAWWDGPGIRSQPDGETERDYRLWYRADQGRVVVASTGIPGSEPGWLELANRSVLEVRRGDVQAVVHPPA